MSNPKGMRMLESDHKSAFRFLRIGMRSLMHTLAHILLGKPRKSDVSDLRTLMSRYRVNPISVSTFPGYALAPWIHHALREKASRADPRSHCRTSKLV